MSYESLPWSGDEECHVTTPRHAASEADADRRHVLLRFRARDFDRHAVVGRRRCGATGARAGSDFEHGHGIAVDSGALMFPAPRAESSLPSLRIASRSTSSPAHTQVTSVGQRESEAMLDELHFELSVFEGRRLAGRELDGCVESLPPSRRARMQRARRPTVTRTRYRPIIPPILLLRDPYVVDTGFDQARRAGIGRFDHQPDRLAGERRADSQTPRPTHR